MNRSRARRASMVVSALLVALPASGQDTDVDDPPGLLDHLRERVSVGGELAIKSAIQTDDGDLQTLQLTLRPEIEVDVSDGIDLTILPRVTVDPVDKLQPGRASQNGLGRLSRRGLIGTVAEIELREFYIATVAGDTFLTIGKQQIVWGTADGLKVLDVVNPQDFREFILDGFDDSRIPLWAFNAEIPIQDLTLQIVWLPDLTYHQIPDPGARFEFVSNVPTLPASVQVIQHDPDRPTNYITDSDVGARLSAFLGGWDLSLNYLYHYDDRPVFFRTLSDAPGDPVVTVNPAYERTHLVGGTFSNAFGAFISRGELGYSSNRFVSTQNVADIDGVHETGEVSYVIGLDYFGWSETLLSVQFFQSVLLDDTVQLLRGRFENNFSVLAQRDFAHDTYTLSTTWIHNTNDGDGVIRPRLTHEFRDNLNLWIGADIFYGTRNGLFGQFGETSRMVFAAVCDRGVWNEIASGRGSNHPRPFRRAVAGSGLQRGRLSTCCTHERPRRRTRTTLSSTAAARGARARS